LQLLEEEQVGVEDNLPKHRLLQEEELHGLEHRRVDNHSSSPHLLKILGVGLRIL
jgi:hypothetical protein